MPFVPKPLDQLTPASMEVRIRREAAKQGLRATRSRWRAGSSVNQGGWQITNPLFNRVEAGERYELSDKQALEWLASDPPGDTVLSVRLVGLEDE